ncbi:hypothetical protein ABZ614_11800 [Streptomyces sp. NPDC013178]|uniref:hypothetical protein n=1 Tax=unclassified Streptomyces TaxID=2593676 RepID=UPI0033D3164C
MPKTYVFTRYDGPQTEAPVDGDRSRPERAGGNLREAEGGHARGKVAIESGAEI